MGRPYIDLTGRTFGKLQVIEPVEEIGGAGKHKRWKCRCECGRSVVVRSSHLLQGDTAQCRSCANKHAATQHGYSKERLYSIWIGMRKRCYDSNSKSYKNYGGRGIYICDEWGAGRPDISGYLAFRQWSIDNGYRNDLSIDRINVNGPYSSNNCQWANRKQQAYNRTNTIQLTIDGKTKPLQEWADEVGIKHETIRHRIKAGWDAHEAVYTPVLST